jgi:hypothetical protein
MIPLLALSASAADRFALVTAASDGGEQRPILRHTAADAERFAEVLGTLGGVSPDGLQLLVDPSLAEVRAALERLGDAAAGHDRAEIVVYFTGHADPQGLQFGAEALPYTELRTAVEAMDADVRVVIIDGCSSGAALRSKGGAQADPLLVEPGLDGVVFLTSSAADEASQESDALGGSYFTHSLTTGLRGAADSSGDGRISLAEAYRYTYASTLALTEQTLGGAQHPSFELRLAGAGDVVLTELDPAGGRLVVPSRLDGAVTIRRAHGDVVAELAENRDQDVVVAVTPGRYELVVRRDHDQLGGTFAVDAEPVAVDPAELKTLPDPVEVRKGGRSPAKALLLGTAVAGYAGAGAAFAWSNIQFGKAVDGVDANTGTPLDYDRHRNASNASMHAFYFSGSVAVLSTTTLALLMGGGR